MRNTQALPLEDDALEIDYKVKWNNPLNCFTYDYLPWSRLSNWLRNIAQFFRNFKWAWQRAVKGYSDRDVWGLSDYYTRLFEVTLRQLAATSHGWPPSEDTPTFKDWQKLLLEMADHFYKASEGNEDILHPEIVDYFEEMLSHITSTDYIPESSQIVGTVYKMEERYDDKTVYDVSRDKWVTATQVAAQERQEHLEKGLALLAKYYNDLWD